ncbi:hypothetical protein LTR22_017362 [Elasticomyces elasticus]|nr:hypothetical protein LTR22_017362 [Elasticomyces elasticus]KAK4908886.1 hypothetical protein LTR49_022278 [Elasticomyces elasticus]KAK5753261.1 hypothetical protein LTS12_016663 [Elasticomyces elasticus]
MFSRCKRKDAEKEEHKLGVVLYQQQKYPEAEEILQQAVEGRGKVLGKEDADTLSSKYWLVSPTRYVATCEIHAWLAGGQYRQGFADRLGSTFQGDEAQGRRDTCRPGVV